MYIVTKIMGILNLTPDSFWEPSRYALDVLESGADIVDMGAVSTRPGAPEVSLEEEWRRLEPVLKMLDGSVPVSIDTTRSEIVRRAFDLIGPFTVNDVSAGLSDPSILPLAGRLSLPFVAMHSRGTPSTMDSLTLYKGGFLKSILAYFRDFSIRAECAGVSEWILDPGFGFAKTASQNRYLVDHLEVFGEFGRPVLAGLSNKRFTSGRTEEYHLRALRHGASILRVHDVEAARRTVSEFARMSMFQKI